ncbi:RagB/SusD family nutrient uptake outer membrane protein [Flammeovirga sp. MY04]|uniref:RagB/SusD family nutrient uptake outer membrane protein n=1 Tax=Flammeovirga sp. MY04 TaxID=1191459 RepID=UPI00080639D0|nr:RagB/SusD family nutrient uptake outer membrane protein [Flammeovirga sp. MY04]ANQ51958.1 RagB/SusD family nutrient uptake outer membrane protein [Flammeovirga sp. MY04]
MKKILIALIAFIGINSGCSNLDLLPHDDLVDDSFWKSEEDFQMAVNGCYQFSDGRQSDIFWVAQQDRNLDHQLDLVNGGMSGSEGICFGTANAGNNYVTIVWSNIYKGLRRCNNYYEKTQEAIESGRIEMSDNIKHMNGQVRIIRAAQYFKLASFWGDVPMPLKTLSRDEANTILQTSQSEIFEFVESELLTAAEELEGFSSSVNAYQSTAAYAYLVRLYMMQKEWSKVETMARKIFDSGKHALYTTGNPSLDYWDLFTPKANNNTEAIVAHNFTNNTWDYSHNTFEVTSMWELAVPSLRLTDLYWNDKGQVIKWVDQDNNVLTPRFKEDEILSAAYGEEVRVIQDGVIYTYPDDVDEHIGQFEVLEANRDPRYAQTFAPFNGWDGAFWSSGNRYSSNFMRTIFIKGYDDENEINYYNNNQMHVIRLAEIYLSLAEALNEQGRPGEAVQYVNMIRDRVGMVHAPTSSVEATRELIRRERQIEFCHESVLYFDYLRWDALDGTSKNFWEETTRRDYAPGASTNFPEGYTSRDLDPSIAIEAEKIAEGHNRVIQIFNRNSNNAVGKIWNPRNHKWPIPQSEVQINPNLIQNPGY